MDDTKSTSDVSTRSGSGTLLFAGIIAIFLLTFMFLWGRIIKPFVKYLWGKLARTVKSWTARATDDQYVPEYKTPDVFKDAPNLAPAKEFKL